MAGVCGSGKSTLVDGLKKHGYHVHTVAQEHSYAPHMYEMTQPDYIILLDCSLLTIKSRRNVPWGKELLSEQRNRLRKLKENCDLYINTDNKTPQQVLQIALDSLKKIETKKP